MNFTLFPGTSEEITIYPDAYECGFCYKQVSEDEQQGWRVECCCNECTTNALFLLKLFDEKYKDTEFDYKTVDEDILQQSLRLHYEFNKLKRKQLKGQWGLNY